MITFDLLNKYNEIAHFCTSRNGGVSMGNYASFNLSLFSGDDPSNVTANRDVLCRELEIENEKLIVPFQTHGTIVSRIDESFFQLSETEKNGLLNGVDALVTSLPGICIGVTTADCVPLLFFDPVQKAIAVAHAGWRGTCGRIAAKTVELLTQAYNSDPQNVRVGIGPSISVNVYEVGTEVVDQFKVAGFDTEQIVVRKNGSLYLDLWKANELLLCESGILRDNIGISGICSFTEHDKFFSARRLGIQSGRMLSGMMLKEIV